MNQRLAAVFITGLCLATTPLLAEKVSFDQLPEAVQNTIRAHAGDAQIEDIDRNVKNGRVVYEAGFKKNGRHVELQVLQDGSVVASRPPGAAEEEVADPRPAVPLSDATKVELNEVPEPVRETIQAQAQGARIEDIDKGKLNGQTVYQAAFKRDGQHVELRVSEEGQVLSPNVVRTPINQRQLTQAQFDQLPPAVQRTVRMHVGPEGLTDIDKQVVAGRTAYEIEFQRDGRPAQILVAQDGSLIEPVAGQQVISRTPTRQPDQKVSMQQLPVPVQNTIRAYSGRAQIEDIDMRTEQGQTIYEAAFKRRGQHTELLVAQDGSLLGLRTPAVGAPQAQPEVGRQRGADLAQEDAELAGLPRPVQIAIQNRIGSADINKIEREEIVGNVYYEVEFMQNGREQEFHVREDGRILD